MSLGYLATSLMLSPAFRTNVSGRRLPSHKKNVYHPAFTKKEVQTYAKWGLAWTTNRVYELGEKRSFQFCLSNRLMSREGDILPASEITLIYVASYLARTIKHSSIKLYLAAVRNLHISCGHGDPLSGKLLLKKILRGIFTLPRSVILRQPVTPGFLQAIKPILHSWLGDHNFTMVRAAFFLAFFAFLRCNEFIYQGISRFRPRLTCPLTVCRYSPIWLPRSECLFFLRLPSPMPFAKGIRLLLHAPPHRFVR